MGRKNRKTSEVLGKSILRGIRCYRKCVRKSLGLLKILLKVTTLLQDLLYAVGLYCFHKILGDMEEPLSL